MKKWWRAHRHAFYGALGKPLINLLMGTVRVSEHHLDRVTGQPGGTIVCGLHANGLAACWSLRRRRWWTLVSLSRDGELQNRIYTSFGFRTVRGSSGSSGIRATIEAIKLLQSSKSVLLIAIDGPRGPRGVVQSGAVMMAKKSGAALVPIGLSSGRRWHAKTWDLFQIPKPFSRMAVVYGEPIFVPAGSDADGLEATRKELEEGILAAEAEADAISGYVAAPGEKRECV